MTLRLSLFVACAVALTACDDGGVASRGISTLGLDFLAVFNADPNSEPVDAQSVSLKLTPTAEPFNP